MKFLDVLVPAAIVGVSLAQNSTSDTMEVTVTEYTYTDVCSSTGTITSTYCNECTHTEEAGPWTTYTTVYKEWCPTGLADKTYTITESCEKTGQPLPTNHVPKGFSVVTEKCPICETEMTAVLTTPVAKATSMPAPASTPPWSSMSPAPAPSAAPAAPSASAPSGASPGSAMPSSVAAGSMPPTPGQPAPQGYVATNSTSDKCETCGPSNSTMMSPPIKAAKASYTSLNILVAVAAIFIAALFTAS